MNILVIGLGSIGSRHVRALQEMDLVNNIFALRSRKSQGKDMKGVKNIYDLSELNETIDRILVTNPTSMHISTLEQVLPFDCPVFIDKPLSHTVADVEEILPLLESFEHPIMIGYVLRFHPLFTRVKELLDQGKIGEVYHSHLKVGQYLPSWHEGEDYRTLYAARKDLGGGALRTLSHELDMSLHLFGVPRSVLAQVDTISDLEIDVDDYSFLSLRQGQSTHNVEMNFLDPGILRRGEIYGREGKIFYNFVSGSIDLIYNNGESDRVFDSPAHAYDKMYLNQMEAFLKIDTHPSSYCDWKTGLLLMRIIESAEVSSQKNAKVEIHE